MNLRKKWRWLAVIVVAVIPLMVILHALFGRPEPVYGGRKLSSWFHEATIVPYDVPNAISFMAIHSMGTSAVPFLTSQLRHEDTKLDELYRKYFPKLPPNLQRHLASPLPPYVRQERAAMLLAGLGPQAEPAFPTMLAAYNRTYCAQFNLPKRSDVDWAALLAHPLLPRPAWQSNLKPAESRLRMHLLHGFTTMGGGHKGTVPLLLAALRSTGQGFAFSISNWTATSTNLTTSIELAQPSLMIALTDSIPDMRGLSAILLGSLAPDHPELIAPLATATQDPVRGVRYSAFKSLWKTSAGMETILPLAARAMDDSDPAIRSLGMGKLIRSTGGREQLMVMLKKELANPDPSVRIATTKILGNLPGFGRLTIPQLTELTQPATEPDEQVRLAAAASLAKLQLSTGVK